jgi:hypothetical protein
VTRPTQEALVQAQHQLSVLACDTATEDAFNDLAAMIALLIWAGPALDQAHREASWPAGGERHPQLGGGTIGGHTIGRHGLNRPVEERLDWGAENGKGQRGGPWQPPVEPNDRVYQDLRRMREAWHRQLGSWRDRWTDEAKSKAGWPK